MAKKILIIDDDRLNVALIKFAFKAEDYEVVTAADGQGGLDVFKVENPDLIVLDIYMPGLSGFEFMNELKALPGGSDIPVIVVTASEHMEDVFKAEGVRHYIVKPIEPAELELKVRECLI